METRGRPLQSAACWILRRAAGRKLRSVSGASLIMAICAMMVVAVLCASMMMTAAAAGVNAVSQMKQQQDYLAVTSAANVLEKMLSYQAETGRYDLIQAMETVSSDANTPTVISLKIYPGAAGSEAVDSLSVTIAASKSGDTLTAVITRNSYSMTMTFEAQKAEVEEPVNDGLGGTTTVTHSYIVGWRKTGVS